MTSVDKDAYIRGYKNGYKDATCKLKNIAPDGRKSGEWATIPTVDLGAEMDDFRHEIALLKDTQIFLEARIKKLERAFWGE